MRAMVCLKVCYNRSTIILVDSSGSKPVVFFQHGLVDDCVLIQDSGEMQSRGQLPHFYQQPAQ